jgi:hypothetical protein
VPARLLRIWTAVVFVLLWSYDVRADPALSKGFASDASGNVVHTASDTAFPPEFHGLRRTTTRAYDATGANASVDYEYTSPFTKITVFIYPRTEGAAEPASEYKSAFDAAIKPHSNAVVYDQKAGKIGGPPNQLCGFVGALSWTDEKGALGSWVILVPSDKWFFKVRTTYDFRKDVMQASFSVSRDLLRSLRQWECLVPDGLPPASP